jgi:trypsin
MPRKSKKNDQRDVKQQMKRLERRVHARAAQDVADDEEDQLVSSSAEAAREYASRIGGTDPVKFVQAFQAAFNIAVGAQAPETSERAAVRRALRSDVPLPPHRFYTDPTFVENTARLIRDQNRIVGGVPTKDFPDCVAVGAASQWCCTGTLVASNVVLTAGHCQGGCSSRIFIGTNVNAGGEIVGVVKAVRHPNYNQGGKHNDVTVLILERDVKTVKPRKIATATMINKAASVRAVGFGNTDPQSTTGYGIKRMVDVPVASASCAADGSTRYGCDKGFELVAGAPFLNKDSCNGDSGGPIYVKSGSQWYLAGATSRATVDSTRPCGDGGIYARADKYATWISSVPGGHWS